MGNTFFYNEAKKEHSKITWKDILSESFRKHSKSDLEYAMATGTAMNKTTEENMLQKWHKPWVWFYALKAGIVLILLIYLIFWGIDLAIGYTYAARSMMLIIPPMVFPLVLCIFLWELNIPQNISVYELCVYVLLGGFISIAVVPVFSLFIPDEPDYWAAFKEEPAKLITALIFLALAGKKKKIYGISGLVIGAAVGCGFGGFESIQYAMDAMEDYGLVSAIMNQIMRGGYAVAGHTVYCAPYVAAAALHMKDSKLSAGSFLNQDFIVTYLVSTAMHFWWNSVAARQTAIIEWEYVVITVILWISLLYITKKCLKEVVSIGNYQSGSAISYPSFSEEYAPRRETAETKAGGTITVVCIGGVLKGAVWQSSGKEILYIGRAEGSGFRYPDGTKGVSGNHCNIQYTPQGWAVVDSSTYGTEIRRVGKLQRGAAVTLQSGDVITLAGTQQAFQVTIQ